MTGSLCHSPETVTILFINQLYTKKKIKMFKIKRKYVSEELAHFLFHVKIRSCWWTQLSVDTV